MKAVRLLQTGAPSERRVQVLEIPDPEFDDSMALVRVAACGICASDVHVCQGKTPVSFLPVTLGHEAAGVVVEDASGRLAPGTRVSVALHWPCGACEACKAGNPDRHCSYGRTMGVDVEGAMAEFVAVPPNMLVEVADNLTWDEAAILTDAVATPFRAIRRAGVSAGDVVAIFGVGGLGLQAVTLARALGAQVIAIDVRESALDRALVAGADVILDARSEPPHRVIRREHGGASHSFEFVGHSESAQQAIQCLRNNGRATLVGLSPDSLVVPHIDSFVSKELLVMGSFASSVEDLRTLMAMAAAGELDLSANELITASAEEAPAWIDQLEDGQVSGSRVVVHF